MRVRKACKEELFNSTGSMVAGVVFVQKSLGNNAFTSYFMGTNSSDFSHTTYYALAAVGAVYVPQKIDDLCEVIDSNIIEIPVVQAKLTDIAHNKFSYRYGKAYWLARKCGHISNRTHRIGMGTHYGELMECFKEGRLYVQAHFLTAQIQIINAAPAALKLAI